MGNWNEKFGNNFTDNFSEMHKQAMQQKNIETGGAYQAKVSGAYGEFTISAIFKSLPDCYHVLDDVLLQQGILTRPYQPNIYGPSKFKVIVKNGRQYEVVKKSTQLDHIIVSPYGIFVIETKNHKGYIFGDVNGKVWTQTLTGGAYKYTFMNPVHQNEGHMVELSKQLKMPRNNMVGMIVFTNPEAYLGNVNCNCCYTVDMLYEAILSFNRPLWNNKQVENVIRAIEKIDTNSYTESKLHELYVQDIKDRHEINKRLSVMKRGGHY